MPGNLADHRLGHEPVDGEHGVQLQLVEALQDALRRGGRREDAAELLDRLLVFTDMHFGSEELLMRHHAYPRYGEHVDEHRRLLEQLRAIEGRLRSRQDAAPLVDDLRRWIGGHIGSMDRDLTEHALREAGRGPARRAGQDCQD